MPSRFVCNNKQLKKPLPFLDLVDEAARRREPAEGKRQEHEHEHEQDSTADQALAKVGSEEEGKRRYALADE